MIERNLALNPPRTKGDIRVQSSKSLKIPQNPSNIPPIKAGYIKGPQKSVANYVTAHTLLSSLSNIYNISQMFHRHITIFLQRFRIKNNRVYFIYYDMECLLPNGI